MMTAEVSCQYFDRWDHLLILNTQKLGKERLTEPLMTCSILKFLEGYAFKWHTSIESSISFFLSSFINIILGLSLFISAFFQLQDYVECAGSHARVILVPSIRDANHDLVFPQVMILTCIVSILFEMFMYLRCSCTIVLQPAFDIHPSDLRHQVLGP